MPNTPLWTAVDSLVDRAPRLSDLRAHGLHLLAAERWRSLGRDLPGDLAAERRLNTLRSLAVAPLLERARDACDAPLVVMKGPELAAGYPDPALRPFRDLDLLTQDAGAAQQAMVAAGFVTVGSPELYVGIHHLRPLCWPGLPLVVEVHARPKWVDGLTTPSTAELIAAAVPSTSGVDGVLALAPAHHVLAAAAHSWAHSPLRSLLHVIDIAALLEDADASEVESLARRWGLERMWRSTRRATGWALYGERRPVLMGWADNLPAVRERTVLESHLVRYAAAFWALPPRQAAAAAAEAMRASARPEGGEPVRLKLRRTRRAIADAFARLSDHHLALERQGEPDGPATGTGRRSAGPCR